MIVIWLIVWLIKDTPALHEWNAWLVSLIICAAISFFDGEAGGVRARARKALK